MGDTAGHSMNRQGRCNRTLKLMSCGFAVCVCGHVPALHYRESAFMNEGRQSDEQTTLSVVRCLVIVLEA